MMIFIQCVSFKCVHIYQQHLQCQSVYILCLHVLHSLLYSVWHHCMCAAVLHTHRKLSNVFVLWLIAQSREVDKKLGKRFKWQTAVRPRVRHPAFTELQTVWLSRTVLRSNCLTLEGKSWVIAASPALMNHSTSIALKLHTVNSL